MLPTPADAETGKWYGDRLIAARFAGHPEPQRAVVVRVDDGDGPSHAITTGVPRRWPWFDEWYNFDENPRAVGGARVLLRVDEAGYDGGAMGEDHPLAWCRELGTGRVFYTALGHFAEAWDDEVFLGHVVAGIRWVAREN